MSTRKALICGVSHYVNYPDIKGCVNDAEGMKNVLSRHGNGKINFNTKLLLAKDAESSISRNELKNQIGALFEDNCDIALLYFSGHGHLESSDGYLTTSECIDGDDGVSMQEIVTLANKSKAREKIIIFDCCHSGIAGSLVGEKKYALISEGVSIFTAAEPYQFAVAKNGFGVFTKLFIEALSGGAADVLGHVTVGSIYSYIDGALCAWEQTPLVRLNLNSFSNIREVKPPIDMSDIRSIIDLFEKPDSILHLDPSFEESSEICTPENLKTFEVLKNLYKTNLIETKNGELLYYAAHKSGACRLTKKGRYYFQLLKKNKI